VYPTPANGSGHFDIKTTLTFRALRLQWAIFRQFETSVGPIAGAST
jgi:hypothetical protein